MITNQIYISKSAATEAFITSFDRDPTVTQLLIDWFANKVFPTLPTYIEIYDLAEMQTKMALMSENVKNFQQLDPELVNYYSKIAGLLLLKGCGSHENATSLEQTVP